MTDHPILTDIAKEHLSFEPSETEATRTVAVAQAIAALRAAYEAGAAAATAFELGIEHAVFDPRLARFPWQVHGKGGRCDLFSEDLCHHSRIRSAYSPTDDGPHAVDPARLPTALLDAVRSAQAKDRSR